jgi:hypothetical protein
MALTDVERHLATHRGTMVDVTRRLSAVGFLVLALLLTGLYIDQTDHTPPGGVTHFSKWRHSPATHAVIGVAGSLHRTFQQPAQMVRLLVRCGYPCQHDQHADQ